MVKEGRFREDLYYRLNVITVDLPPLRDRPEDIPLLVAHFLQRFCIENGKPLLTMNSEALRPLMDYAWPGNVRELENVVERAVVLSSGSTIGVDLISDHIIGRAPITSILEGRPDASLFDIMEECERRIIIDMLEKVNWNQTEAADRFHVPLSTLNQKIKRLNVEIKKRMKE
jgi:DNA-binding NtrC family response regulator